MGSAIYTVAHSPPEVDSLLRYLSSLGLAELLESTWHEFWPSICFTALWLLMGHLRAWGPAYYPLPFLVWTFEASLELLETFGACWITSASVTIDLMLSMLAFVLIAAMVVLAAALRPHLDTRGGLLPFAGVLAALAALLTDYALSLLLLCPLS